MFFYLLIMKQLKQKNKGAVRYVALRFHWLRSTPHDLSTMRSSPPPFWHGSLASLAPSQNSFSELHGLGATSAEAGVDGATVDTVDVVAAAASKIATAVARRVAASALRPVTHKKGYADVKKQHKKTRRKEKREVVFQTKWGDL